MNHKLNHDGVFVQAAYVVAMDLAARRGQVVQDIGTGAIVIMPQPERSHYTEMVVVPQVSPRAGGPSA